MTEQELARLIAALEHLKRPFDRKQIGKIPAASGRPELDFVNHAHVTNRLNQYAPEWNYTVDETFEHGGKFWVRGTMTIHGASRVEYGMGKNPLEAVSHFIRRAAMRFGVATDLWAKEDFESGETAAGERAAAAPAAQRPVPDGEGEAPTGTGESSDTGLVVAPGDAEEAGDSSRGAPAASSASEPHTHVPGKRLASGKALCIWEDADGKVCGKPFRIVTPVTVHTVPVGEDEARLDLA